MKKITVLFILVLHICGCGRYKHNDIYGDLLKVNDTTYICCNIAIPDRRVIGPIISKVKNKVADYRTVQGTFLGNGDSLNLKKGTSIHKIANIDAEDMIAVNWKNDRYITYVNCEKADELVETLRKDIEFAIGVRLSHYGNDNEEKYIYFFDFDTVNSIKKAFYDSEEHSDELEKFNKFYTIEFLIPDAEDIYKPCLSILCRASDSFEYGIIYDNGVRKFNFDIKNLIK